MVMLFWYGVIDFSFVNLDSFQDILPLLCYVFKSNCQSVLSIIIKNYYAVYIGMKTVELYSAMMRIFLG